MDEREPPTNRAPGAFEPWAPTEPVLPPPPVRAATSEPWTTATAPPPQARVVDRVLGVLIIAFGALLVVGAVGLLVTGDSRIPDPVLYMEAVMGAATVAGGIYIVRGGLRKGRPAMSVLAVLPVSVLIVLIVVGVFTRESVAHSPKDAYGYSEFEKQSFVTGCGGGARCECLFGAVERQIPHADFVSENQRYEQTGSFSPGMVEKLTQVSMSSGC